MEFIYTLRCQKDKYYIGKTYNVQIEYNEHLDGTFCDITKEYKPYDIECILEVDDNISLEIVIAKYLNRYGSSNIYFHETDKKTIKRLRKEDNKKCICDKEHWLVECELNQKDKFWTNVLNRVVNKLTTNFKKSGICYRCGRYGHEVDECYARTHIEGHDLEDSDEECDFD